MPSSVDIGDRKKRRTVSNLDGREGSLFSMFREDATLVFDKIAAAPQQWQSAELVFPRRRSTITPYGVIRARPNGTLFLQ
jgi:hypothetical protein